MMRLSVIAVTAVLAAAPFATAADAPKCSDVVAAMELAGGSKSAEQIAKQLNTSVEHVRQCWDEYDTARKATPGK